MARKFRWTDLSRAQRTTVAAVALADTALRAWALADLAGRPQSEIKGSKRAWAVALGVINSVGIVPAAHLEWARRDG